MAGRHSLAYLDLNFTGAPISFRSSRLTMCPESSRPDYDPLAGLQRVALRDYGPNGLAMFVCHPGYLDEYRLKSSSLTTPCAREAAMAADSATRAWLAENGVEVVSCDQL